MNIPGDAECWRHFPRQNVKEYYFLRHSPVLCLLCGWQRLSARCVPQVSFLFSVKRMKSFRLFHLVRLAILRANKGLCASLTDPVHQSLPHASERSKCLSAAISAESFLRLQNLVSVLVCSVLTSLPSECISVLIVVNAYVLNKISLVVLQRVMFTYLTVGKCFDII